MLSETEKQLVEKWQYLIFEAMRLYHRDAARMGRDEFVSAAGYAIVCAANNYDGIRPFTPIAREYIRRAVQYRKPKRFTLPTFQLMDHDVTTDGDEYVTEADSKLDVAAMLASLNERERFVMQRMELDGAIGRDVAKELGCSKQRVYQIREEAIGKLREQYNGYDPA